MAMVTCLNCKAEIQSWGECRLLSDNVNRLLSSGPDDQDKEEEEEDATILGEIHKLFQLAQHPGTLQELRSAGESTFLCSECSGALKNLHDAKRDFEALCKPFSFLSNHLFRKTSIPLKPQPSPRPPLKAKAAPKPMSSPEPLKSPSPAPLQPTKVKAGPKSSKNLSSSTQSSSTLPSSEPKQTTSFEAITKQILSEPRQRVGPKSSKKPSPKHPPPPTKSGKSGGAGPKSFKSKNSPTPLIEPTIPPILSRRRSIAEVYDASDDPEKIIRKKSRISAEMSLLKSKEQVSNTTPKNKPVISTTSKVVKSSPAQAQNKNKWKDIEKKKRLIILLKRLDEIDPRDTRSKYRVSSIPSFTVICNNCSTKFNSLESAGEHTTCIPTLVKQFVPTSLKPRSKTLAPKKVQPPDPLHNLKNELKKEMNYSKFNRTNTCQFRGCTLSFPTNEEFQEHRLTHLWQSNFVCHYCGSCYNWKHDYQRHLRIKHPGAPFPEDLKAPQKASNFKCNYPKCGKAFPDRTSLSTHYDELHMKKKPPPMTSTSEFSRPSSRYLNPGTTKKYNPSNSDPGAVGVYKCDFPNCTATYKTIAQINFHKEAHNRSPSEYPFLCSYCQIRFKLKKSRNQHERKTHPFDREISIRTDIEKKKGTRPKSPIKNPVPSSPARSILKAAKKRNSAQPVKVKFNFATKLAGISKDKSGASGPPPVLFTSWKCEICNRKFITQSIRDNHMKNAHGGAKAGPSNADNLNSSTPDPPRNSSPIHSDGSTTPDASPSSSPAVFIPRIKKIKKKSNSSSSQTFCSTCNIGYSNLRALIRHRKTQLHKTNLKFLSKAPQIPTLRPKTDLKKGDVPKKTFCTYCNRDFENNELYLHHTRGGEHRLNKSKLENESKPLEDLGAGSTQTQESDQLGNTNGENSNDSGGSGGRKRSVVNYYEDTPDPSLQCTKCDRILGSRSALTLHEKSHALSPDFVCGICNAQFLYFHHLNQHIKNKHTSAGPPIFKCSQCPENFNYQELLDEHITKEHSDPISNFNCDICYINFTKAEDLFGHFKSDFHLRRAKEVEKNAEKSETSEKPAEITQEIPQNIEKEGQVVENQIETQIVDTNGFQSESSNLDGKDGGGEEEEEIDFDKLANAEISTLDNNFLSELSGRKDSETELII